MSIETTAAEVVEPAETDDADTPIPGEESLGDPGKQALARMKAEKREAERKARDAEARLAEAVGDGGKKALDTMRAAKREAEDRLAEALAKIEGREKEHAAQVAQREVEAAALAKANERILKAEVRAVAASALADPADALLYLDLSGFEVGDDGEVDTAAVTAAIDDLVKRKPYLAAQGGAKFKGTADGGTRKESAKSIDDQIAEATKAGNHRLAISLKRQKAYADTN